MTKAKPLIWCDPPARATPVFTFVPEWQPTIDALKDRAGTWAMLRVDMPHNRARFLRTSLNRRFPDCEFTIRKTGDGIASVWGRANA